MSFLIGLGFICLGVALLAAFVNDQKVRRREGKQTVWAASVGIDERGQPIGMGKMLNAMIPGLMLLIGAFLIFFGVVSIF